MELILKWSSIYLNTESQPLLHSLMTFQIQSIYEFNLKPEITVKNSAPLAPDFNLGGLICSHVNSLP